jgi:hypothetical protein
MIGFKPASPRTEEMEGVTYIIAGSQMLFRSIPENLCDSVAAMWCLLDSRAKMIFVQINVQWIGQWSLFSRCGISQNQ